MIYKVKNPTMVRDFFAGWEETLLWSCLDQTMGEIYVDSLDNPQSVMAWIADFCFYNGEPNRELLMYVPNRISKKLLLMVPSDESLANMIEEVYSDSVEKVTRYATKKDTVFDIEKLKNIVSSIDSTYYLEDIDEKRYYQCKQQLWSEDLVGQYQTYEDFKRLGLGKVIIKDGKIVAGASSYTRYRQGIEIEIDTKKEFRRQGLAYICGASLILQCIKQNLYPSWDAHSKASLALAQKLGYQFAYEYTTYIKHT